mmetsp:Transcript_88155/g.153147  ORF Transcript_88155/g.153147 Transcript_88155/m.153147 type:complete len:102 (-) Transcript_88155:1275-1580(-)
MTPLSNVNVHIVQQCPTSAAPDPTILNPHRQCCSVNKSCFQKKKYICPALLRTKVLYVIVLCIELVQTLLLEWQEGYTECTLWSTCGVTPNKWRKRLHLKH